MYNFNLLPIGTQFYLSNLEITNPSQLGEENWVKSMK
jgi:hypothetical protein